ncbi:MAG TPA: hypothetical protein VGE98_17225 [Thermoanaerobaculia bacterium]
MRGFRKKRGRTWSAAVRAGTVGRCPGRRHDRSHSVVPGQLRRMSIDPDELTDLPDLEPDPLGPLHGGDLLLCPPLVADEGR